MCCLRELIGLVCPVHSSIKSRKNRCQTSGTTRKPSVYVYKAPQFIYTQQPQSQTHRPQSHTQTPQSHTQQHRSYTHTQSTGHTHTAQPGGSHTTQRQQYIHERAKVIHRSHSHTQQHHRSHEQTAASTQEGSLAPATQR